MFEDDFDNEDVDDNVFFRSMWMVKKVKKEGKFFIDLNMNVFSVVKDKGKVCVFIFF